MSTSKYCVNNFLKRKLYKDGYSSFIHYFPNFRVAKLPITR